MDLILEQFLIQFRSPNTKKSYQNDILQFFEFCEQNLSKPIAHPSQINETLCTIWQQHTKNTPNVANNTLARKMAALSSFLKFCQRKKLITVNVMEFLVRPKISPDGKTNILTKEEWIHIFNYLQNRIEFARIHCKDIQYKLWKKRYSILYTLYTVGMRVEELCQLKREDLEKINEDIYRLHLTVKGNERHAPLIHKKTALLLIDYMNAFQINKQTSFIFENIHRTSVYHIVKLCVKEAGIFKKISPHSLRASLATHLHQEGVPLGHIKDLLNHKNISTTLLYTRISEAELQENANLLGDLTA